MHPISLRSSELMSYGNQLAPYAGRDGVERAPRFYSPCAVDPQLVKGDRTAALPTRLMEAKPFVVVVRKKMSF